MKDNLALAALSRLDEHLPRWREVPLYRHALSGNGGAPFDFHEEFFRLPFITKREMREGFPRNFLRADQRLESLLEDQVVELEHTSGTSEEQTPVLFRRGWWNEQEERALRLNSEVARTLDEFPAARRATLTTPTCNGSACHTAWMSRTERTIGNTLYVNLARIPFLLKADAHARMADEIAEWAPQFLDTDPVHAAWFALYCEKHGRRFPSLKFILASYEYVSVAHKRILERVFQVPVLNLYGSTETGHLLMEDARGELRPSAETAFLEIIHPDTAGVGDLVVTTLSNDFMPLVRYRIGDLVQRHGEAYVVHGRARDALKRADGRRVTTHDVDQCFAGIAGVAHYQLRQEDQGAAKLDVIADGAGPAAEDLRGVAERLGSLLQLTEPLKPQVVDSLLPSPSGKFRLTQRA